MDDYRSMGFMCGLELHQRLATREKLFCSCPTVIDEKAKPMAKVLRYQRAVAGELGAIDVSAQFEEMRKRGFVYEVYDDNACLVELDEEPPHPMNTEALQIALSMASALGMKTVDEIQPMRKAVVDGSDPSAFQRTALVALDGSIKLDGASIGIPAIFLEEESSGIVESRGDTVVYSIDRLGIPLVEIDTDPTIPSPAAAKELALRIGTLLRLTGKVQRGIGSIRQDVNMSIRDGARVEIKGVQELGLIDRFLEVEIKRQQKLIELMRRLKKAGAGVEQPKDVTRLFANTKVNVIRKQANATVLAFALRGFKGALGTEIAPNRRLGTEVSDYAKKGGVHGIIHSDENLESYGFASNELAALQKELKLGKGDSFVLIAGARENVSGAAELARFRAEHAIAGIPKETRMAGDTELCTTSFLRPLPTGSRMYPETDARPIVVDSSMLEQAKRSAPDIDKEMAYITSRVKNRAIAEQLIRSPRLQAFKDITAKTRADPEFVANTLLQKLTELRRQGFNVDGIDEKSLCDIFEAYAKEKVTKNAVEELIKAAAKGAGTVADMIKRGSLSRIKDKELRTLVSKEKSANKSMSANELRDRIMARYRLNVDGGELNDILKA